MLALCTTQVSRGRVSRTLGSRGKTDSARQDGLTAVPGLLPPSLCCEAHTTCCAMRAPTWVTGCPWGSLFNAWKVENGPAQEHPGGDNTNADTSEPRKGEEGGPAERRGVFLGRHSGCVMAFHSNHRRSHPKRSPNSFRWQVFCLKAECLPPLQT